MSRKEIFSKTLDALPDKGSKAIFIHKDRRNHLPFEVGDRCSIHGAVHAPSASVVRADNRCIENFPRNL